MKKNSTRDVDNKRSNGDRRVLEECCRHHRLTECKRRHDFRTGYLGLYIKRK